MLSVDYSVTKPFQHFSTWVQNGFKILLNASHYLEKYSSNCRNCFLLNMDKYILVMTLALCDVYRTVMFDPDVVSVSQTGPSVRAF